MNTKNQQLSEAFKITEDMLQEAEAGHWDKVSAVDVERDELLKSFFSKPLATNENLNITKIMYEMLNLNRLIKNMAEIAKRNLRNDINDLSKSRDAANTYASHSTYKLNLKYK